MRRSGLVQMGGKEKSEKTMISLISSMLKMRFLNLGQFRDAKSQCPD